MLNGDLFPLPSYFDFWEGKVAEIADAKFNCSIIETGNYRVSPDVVKKLGDSLYERWFRSRSKEEMETWVRLQRFVHEIDLHSKGAIEFG